MMAMAPRTLRILRPPVQSSSGRTANAPESPTKAIRRWWDQSWREGVTRSVIDRAHKETALVKGREESNDPIFLIQNGAASRSSSISSGELLRQGVCLLEVCVSIAKYRAWGHEYVITSLLENAVILETIKQKGSLRWRPPSPTLIHGHAPCLSGRRPSSAVHHFGG